MVLYILVSGAKQDCSYIHRDMDCNSYNKALASVHFSLISCYLGNDEPNNAAIMWNRADGGPLLNRKKGPNLTSWGSYSIASDVLASQLTSVLRLRSELELISMIANNKINEKKYNLNYYEFLLVKTKNFS